MWKSEVTRKSEALLKLLLLRLRDHQK